MARDIDGAIAERSRTLLGLLTVLDLDELRVSRQMRRSLVAAGVLIPVHRGVYRHRAHPETWAQSVLAATLAAGSGAVASHVTAGRDWRLDGVAGRTRAVEPIDVSVPRGRAPELGPGVRVHRSRDLVLADVERRRLVPVTTVARTLIDIAPIVSLATLERALDDAEQRGLVWRPHLRWRLDSLAGHGRTGVPQLRALMDRTEGRPLGDSWLEQEAIRIIVHAGLPVPRCQVHLRRSDRRIARVDLLWDGPRLVVELGWPCHARHPPPPAVRRRTSRRAGAGRVAGDPVRLRGRDRTAGLRRLDHRGSPAAARRLTRGAHSGNLGRVVVAQQPQPCPVAGATELTGRRGSRPRAIARGRDFGGPSRGH